MTDDGSEPGDALSRYVAQIDDTHRPTFDRIDALIRGVAPEAEAGISYGIPTYRVGRRRLYLGVWTHGVSLYGWGAGQDAGFVERHPGLVSGKGTIKLRLADAAAIPDEEFTDLARDVLLDSHDPD